MAEKEEALPIANRDLIFEDLRPRDGLQSPKVFVAAEHHAKTRRGLAIAILAILGGLYLVGAAGFLFGLIKGEDLAKLIASFSGIQTLAAAAVGFYFAKEK